MEPSNSLKPTDLRGILEYVPIFRGQIFVVAVDGSIVAHENFANVLTDIAVLRSLNIRLVLVHGVGSQLKALAAARGVELSDAHGSGPTDPATLGLATEATGLVTQELFRGLTQHRISCAQINAVRATELGVLRGVDHQATGKIEKLDDALVGALMQKDIVPVFSPLAFDRNGRALRLNSDLLAAELAQRLGASKLIFLTPHRGLIINGEVPVNIPLEALRQTLDAAATSIDERLRSKARHAAFALEGGVARAHILDGRVLGALLTEIFDKVGLGTMIHANEYQRIRSAQTGDIAGIHNILRNAANRTETVRLRTPEEIEAALDQFFVYEVDESLIGCCALFPLVGDEVVELGSVLVQPFYHGKGVGRQLVEFAIEEAQRQGYQKLIAISTQSVPFFREACGFADGGIDDLPEARRSDYEASGRKGRILIRRLG